MPIPTSRHGDIVPLVTTPPPTTGLPWRAIPGPVSLKGTSFSAGPASRAARTASDADEAGVLLAAPAQAGLDRAALLHQVVAVEVEADLEAQRVARGEAGGHAPRVQQRVPAARRGLGRCQHLDAVLAGVARAAHERLGAVDVRGSAVMRVGRSPSAMASDDLARLRALDGEHRVAVVRVGDVDVERLGLPLEPREVLVVVGGVRDREVAIVAEAVGEEVVEDAAVLAAQHAVLRAARRRSSRRRWRGCAAGSRSACGPLRLDLAHVRDVEDAGAGAHRDVLVPDARVLDRHLPAGERDELRARRDVAVVERGPAEGLGRGGSHRRGG